MIDERSLPGARQAPGVDGEDHRARSLPAEEVALLEIHPADDGLRRLRAGRQGLVCRRLGRPVYTRVSLYYDWIKKHVYAVSGTIAVSVGPSSIWNSLPFRHPGVGKWVVIHELRGLKVEVKT